MSKSLWEEGDPATDGAHAHGEAFVERERERVREVRMPHVPRARGDPTTGEELVGECTREERTVRDRGGTGMADRLRITPRDGDSFETNALLVARLLLDSIPRAGAIW